LGRFDSHQFRTRISKEKDKFPRAAANINEGTSWLYLSAQQLSGFAQSWVNQYVVEPTVVEILVSFVSHKDLA
jgi:hypothetical protein